MRINTACLSIKCITSGKSCRDCATREASECGGARSSAKNTLSGALLKVFLSIMMLKRKRSSPCLSVTCRRGG